MRIGDNLFLKFLGWQSSGLLIQKVFFWIVWLHILWSTNILLMGEAIVSDR